jgi:hypothetical protein
MPSPDQLYEPPPEPVNTAAVVEHVKVVEFDAVGDGAVVFCATAVLAVAVHPFAAVTRTVKVPPVFTTGLAVVPPVIVPGPDQLYDPPPEPLREAVVVEHVKVVVLDAVGEGAVVFCETDVLAVAVQPLAAVTVKLYVPGKLTEGVAVEPPLVIPGPDQLYVPPPEPVKPIVVVLHVNVDELEAVGEGAVVF